MGDADYIDISLTVLNSAIFEHSPQVILIVVLLQTTVTFTLTK